MAHRGKTYPVYNPARVLVQDAPWGRWFPTEYSFSVYEWGGPLGSFCPVSGRGILPSAYTIGDSFLVYKGDFTLFSGDVLTLGYRWEIGTPSVDPQRFLIVQINGVDQITDINTFVSPGNDHDTLVFNDGYEFNPIVGALVDPAIVNYAARLWTDPAPPPPNSAPF